MARFLPRGFAFKVMRQRDYGCAVRCEAVALPRRQSGAIEWGYAPKRFAKNALIKNEGAARHLSIKLSAGQSRRRTSDGTAELKNNF